MGDKKVLKRGTLEMNLDDFLKLANITKVTKEGERYEMKDNALSIGEFVNVVVETIKSADEVIKLHEQFKKLTEDGKYAFLCAEIEYIADETGVSWQKVLSNIRDVMTDENT